ncbi:MAG: pantetheine-phosphate adenylyltransferase [Deltaproteobacteria bacterium]|nr:pantetheine-phosphate adenylyltransferase [Deltaproteobacteria bacterium]
MPVRAAVYAGSFDPVTLGHLDIIQRGACVFERVIVGVGENPAKRYLLPKEVRIATLREVTREIPNVEVTCFSGLLVDFCRSIGAGVILRGLRAVADFEFEFQAGLANRDMAPNIETVFLLPAPRFIFISSSLVKEILVSGGDVSAYVPAAALAALKAAGTGRPSP